MISGNTDVVISCIDLLPAILMQRVEDGIRRVL